MRTLLLAILALASCGMKSAGTTQTELARQNIERAIAIADATWAKAMKGSEQNLYMADLFGTHTNYASGASDVWPYTAAIEAHCSMLEAVEAMRPIDPAFADSNSYKIKHRLEVLIDNLEYYRGTFVLSSYATTLRLWKPYAVPRASSRGGADVKGILNVYDDQMWLARELIRAYRLTKENAYLDLATYLADYVLDGWDCWRDDDGREYGGITWGPGYNSKHACSNAPIIQPLVWLYQEYKDSDATTEYYYRDADNTPVHESRLRSELYLEFARKVYSWQKEKLLADGVFWDMMGADGKIILADGYRQHVDCGGPTGAFYSYNTGTMIAGAAELYKATGEDEFKADLAAYAKASLNKFTTYRRTFRTYEFNTDPTAESGFNTWFNNVLLRAMADAEPICDNPSATNALDYQQSALDYAFDHHNCDNLLPIHLLDGWREEAKTKAFHQFTFAAEYAVLALRQLSSRNTDAIQSKTNTTNKNNPIYTLAGIPVASNSQSSLPPGLYIVGQRKQLKR